MCWAFRVQIVLFQLDKNEALGKSPVRQHVYLVEKSTTFRSCGTCTYFETCAASIKCISELSEGLQSRGYF